MKKLDKKHQRFSINICYDVAAIAPWFRLRLPFCGPGFKSQAHHLRFFQLVLLKLYQENNENKHKRPGLAHLKKPFHWFVYIYILEDGGGGEGGRD